MSKMTNCQNDHGGRELNGEPTHTIIWEPYGILQSFVPHSLHSFNDFILLFIHSFPIRLLSHSFSYSYTLTVIPFNLTISLWPENETLSWIAKTSKNGHFCVTTISLATDVWNGHILHLPPDWISATCDISVSLQGGISLKGNPLWFGHYASQMSKFEASNIFEDLFLLTVMFGLFVSNSNVPYDQSQWHVADALAGAPLRHWGRAKWPPFTRQHFQMHFLEWKWGATWPSLSPCTVINPILLTYLLEWKWKNFDRYFTEVCS